MNQCWTEMGGELHQDRMGGHEQGNVRVSEHDLAGSRRNNTGPRPDLFCNVTSGRGVKFVISEVSLSNRIGQCSW